MNPDSVKQEGIAFVVACVGKERAALCKKVTEMNLRDAMKNVIERRQNAIKRLER